MSVLLSKFTLRCLCCSHNRRINVRVKLSKRSLFMGSSPPPYPFALYEGPDGPLPLLEHST